MSVYRAVLVCALVVCLAACMAYACVGHDGNCVGENGSQGNCCHGMHCQKNDPSWAEGKCYWNPGK